MRGIAASLVCFFHFTNGNVRLLPGDNIVRLTCWWGCTGIEMFFIISGFVIPYSMYVKNYTLADIGTFMLKRIVRIEPPYLVSVALVLVLGYVSAAMPFYRGAPFAPDWKNILGHIAYLNVFTGQKWLQDVYWTLAIEFQFYIIMALCYGFLTSKKMAVRLLFTLIFAGCLVLLPDSAQFIFTHVTYFLTGILLFQYYCRICTDTEFWCLMPLTLAATLYLKGSEFFILSVCTVLPVVFIKKIHPVFVFLGSISYSLYLIHIPVGGRIINIAEVLFQSVYARQAAVLLAYAVCIGFAWLFYRFVEKRFKDASSAIGYNKKQHIAIVQ